MTGQHGAGFRRPDGALLVSGVVYRGHTIEVFQAVLEPGDAVAGIGPRVFAVVDGDGGPETARVHTVLDAVAIAERMVDQFEADHGQEVSDGKAEN